MPTLAELPPFEGDAICQVWLDPLGVRFLFENGPQIYAEFEIEHLDPDGTAWQYRCQAEGGPALALHRLLYKRIVAVDREEMRLTFRTEDGASLSVLSEVSPYEAGHVRVGDTILVF
jgi:hypothetical protein